MNAMVTSYAINFGTEYERARHFVQAMGSTKENIQLYLDNIDSQEKLGESVALHVDNKTIVGYNHVYNTTNQHYGQAVTIDAVKMSFLTIGQDQYIVNISQDGLTAKIGCQTVPFKEVAAVYDEMRKRQ